MSMPKGSCQLPEAARKVARLEARNQQLKDQVARLRAELRDVQRAHKREAARLEAEVTAELSRKELDVAKSAADFALRAKAVAERGNQTLLQQSLTWQEIDRLSNALLARLWQRLRDDMSESLLQEYAAADRSSRDAMAESPEVPSFIDDYAAELHNMYRTILKERDTAKMSAGFRRDAINDREASLEIMERQSAVSARTIEQLRNKLHDMEIANKSLAAVPTPRTPNSPYSPHTPSARSRRMTPSTPSSPKRQLRSPLHTPAIQRQPLGQSSLSRQSVSAESTDSNLVAALGY